MFCPKCGAKALDGAEFCQKCGAKLSTDRVDQKQTEADTQQTKMGNALQDKPKKKKSKKLPIILAAVVLVFVVILIAANSNDLAERGEQAQKDEEYIKSQQASKDVNLSETYTNEEEGISFQYPSAWVPVSEEEFAEMDGVIENGYPLVMLANVTEDLPENTTYIGVSKYTATQEDIDYIFMDDEQFIDSIDSEVSVKDTSITKLDGIQARKFTYFTPNDGLGSESWFYAVGSIIYRIDFSWVGENPGNNQRFFDAVIGSYKITAAETAAGKNDSADDGQIADADKLLYNGIPVGTIMEMKAEDVIAAFGEADYQDDSTLTILNENADTTVIFANFDSAGYVTYFFGDPEKFELNGENLNHDYDKLVKIFGREPDYEETFELLEVRWYFDGYSILLGLDEDGLPGKTEIWKDNAMDSEDNQAELDPELMGRWRSYDGNALTLNDNGTVSDVFSFWNSLNRNPDSVTWEASNGRLILTAIYNTEYKYALGEGRRRINGEDVVTDELNLDRSRIPEAGEYGYYYREKTGSTDLAGTWIHNDSKGLGGNIEFYADGTGMIGDNSLTWYADESNLYYTAEQKAAFDYTVSGDVLTIFFSDGSKVYTRVGN